MKENKDKEQLPKEENTLDSGNHPQEREESYEALWDKYVRAYADFANARKRWEREKEEVIKFSNSALIKDLLVIVDETEQALRMVKEHSNIEEIIKGLEMTYNNFTSILKKRGVRAIESVGKDFDPHLHEIVASKEIDTNIDKPVVLEEIQKGYLFEDKVLRSAKVIVGIKKQTKDQSLSAEALAKAEPKTKDQETETKDKNNKSQE